MSLLDSIADFATGTYTVTRSTLAGYSSDGYIQAPSTSTLSIVASIQPLSGRDLLILTDAERAEETRWLYTVTPLLTLAATNEPDVVSVDGVAWVVKTIERWDDPDGTFYRCKIARRTA